MAEAKKDDKKSGGGIDFGFEDVLLLIIGLIVIFSVLVPDLTNKNTSTNPTASQNSVSSSGVQEKASLQKRVGALYDAFFREQQIDANTREPSIIDQTKFRVTDILKNIFYAAIILSIFFIILFLILKNYFKYSLKAVVEEYNKKIGVAAGSIQTAEDAPDTQAVPAGYVPDTNGISNPKWDMIQAYARSGNQAELRLAIIEADIMLFDVLKKSGFPGDHIGDVLRNINKSQLATIDYAWTAHRVRNELAHQGSNFVLGRTDAEAALDGYKRVFDELGLI